MTEDRPGRGIGADNGLGSGGCPHDCGPSARVMAVDGNTVVSKLVYRAFAIDAVTSACSDINYSHGPEATEKISSNDKAKAPESKQQQLLSSETRKNSKQQNGPDEEEGPIYGARHAIMIFVPITLCMLFVVITIRNTTYYTPKEVRSIYVPFHERATDDVPTRAAKTAKNAFIILGTIIGLTIVLLLLYKFRCYKIIRGWLLLASVMCLFFLSLMYLRQFLTTYDVPMDRITAAVFVWNFGVAGLFCVHWKGPLILQQGYLIFTSGLMALLIIRSLPEWTGWAVLGLMVLWDLIAVLCPKGPLRMLVETAKERDEPIFPAIIYSSTMVWQVVSATQNIKVSQSHVSEAKGPESHTEENTKADEKAVSVDGTPVDPIISPLEPKQPGSRTFRITEEKPSVIKAETEEEDKGVKMGLGDFVFYSVLVGKTSLHGDWNNVLACFVAILIGLCCTLWLLTIVRKALPALPISLTFGLVFHFGTSVLITPFLEAVISRQIQI